MTRNESIALLSAMAVAAPTGGLAQSLPAIRFGLSNNDTYGEPLYGIDSGIFARAGLKVEAQPFSSAGPVATAVAAGAIDVGLTDALLLANAVNHGVPVVGIAGAGLFRVSDPTSALCVAKNSPLKDAKGFENQTIAVGTLVSLTSVAIKMWLTRNGADIAKVRFVEMPFTEMPAALTKGTVAGAYLIEPAFTQAANDVQIVSLPYAAIAPTFAISLVVTTRNWIAQNSDAARKLVAAMYDTARWANQNHPKTAEILAKYSNADVDVVRRMKRTAYATSLDPATVQALLDAAYTSKLIDRPTNAADLLMRI